MASASATNLLRNEHDAILKMLEVAEEAARRINSGIAVSPEVMSGLLEFFRLFADRCHHGKEEDSLFPLLERKGIPREGGPVGVMLHEHDLGRGLIRTMAEASEGVNSGRSESASQWARAAADYAALLRAHIDKENNILFVMAERLLSESEHASLLDTFEKIENERMGAGTHERLHGLMEKLYGDIFPESNK